MKRSALILILTMMAASFVITAAQSRPGTIQPEAPKKTNRRPPPTPTPITPASQTTSSIPEPTPDPDAVVDDSDVITVETQVVSIPVKVVDRSGRFIGGLTKENFTVLEDGVEQQIEFFSNEQQSFTVALVLDMSYSAKFKADEIQNAALAFIKLLRPGDKVMVVSFDQEIYVNCPPTSNRSVIEAAIKSTKISYGTSVYDAMDLVMNQKFKKIEGRKAIVLFSDGVDTTSRNVGENSNLNDALELDALIYPIQYDTYNEVQSMRNKPIVAKPGEIPQKQPNPFPFPFPTGGNGGGIGSMDPKGTSAGEYRQADLYLNELANRTGGRLYKASTIVNLSDAFKLIASELREFYSIAYTPKNADRGKKHKIRVRVDREGAVIRTRDSYVTKK